MAERTVFGYFQLSCNVQSVQLLTIIENLPAKNIVVFMAFVVFILLFIYRITLELLETNVKQYFSKVWNIVDMIIVIQSLGIVAIFIMRNQYVRSLLEHLEETRNNEFVSFIFAAFFDQFMTWWTGILVCISTIRVWKILNFIFIFRVFSLTLLRSAKDLIATTILTFLFIICLGMLYYNLNSSRSLSFSVLSKSFSSLIAILFGFVNDHLSSVEIISGKNWLELILFVTSLGVVAIYLMNMIMTVACSYFMVVHEETKSIERGTFSFWDFLCEEYHQMFGSTGKTKEKLMNASQKSFKQSKERLLLLEKRLDVTTKSMENFLSTAYNK